MKAIIFDFDGVLVNTKSFVLDFFRELGIDYNNYDDFIKDYELGYVNFLQKHGYGLEDVKECEQNYRRTQAKRIDEIRLYPGVKKMLQKLSQKYKLGIVTMNYEDIVRKVLKNNGVEHLFAAVCDQTKGIKPGAEPLLNCMEQLGVKADESLFVGDEKVDVLAARAANVKMIASLYGLHTKDLLKDADDFIEKPEELWEKLNGKRLLQNTRSKQRS